MRKSRAKHLGTSLAEYSLSGMLVVAVVPGLMLLGDGLGQAFAGLQESLSTNTHTSGQTGGQAPSNGTVPGDPTSAAGPYITLSNGTQINLGAYPENPRELLDVTGANGTTEQILASMDSLFQQLLDTNQITEEQASILFKLANQGHEIAAVERLIEDAAAKAGNNYEAFGSMTFMVNGTTYTSPLELAYTIGYAPETREAGSKAANMMALLQEAEASGALQDPAVRQVVPIMVDHILNIANQVESTVVAVETGTVTLDNYQTAVTNPHVWSERYATGGSDIQPDLPLVTAEDAFQKSHAKATHEKSESVCKAGKGKDSGKHCSP